MCTWKHARAYDKFDWLRGKGSTGSSFTGPTADHTKGDSTGMSLVYLLILLPYQKYRLIKSYYYLWTELL